MSNDDYLMMDPPSGWMYGFPKPVPKRLLGDKEALKDWLFNQGFPEDGLELAVKYSRYWNAEPELFDSVRLARPQADALREDIFNDEGS